MGNRRQFLRFNPLQLLQRIRHHSLLFHHHDSLQNNLQRNPLCNLPDDLLCNHLLNQASSPHFSRQDTLRANLHPSQASSPADSPQVAPLRNLLSNLPLNRAGSPLAGLHYNQHRSLQHSPNLGPLLNRRHPLPHSLLSSPLRCHRISQQCNQLLFQLQINARTWL